MDYEQSKTMVTSWIHDLSTELGTELALDADGVCSLQIGQDTLITIEVSTDFPMVFLYCSLLPLPSDKMENAHALLVRALELNAFQALTRGGSIGLLPGGGYLIFSYNTPIEGVDSEMFSRILASFYEAAIDVRKQLTDYIPIESSSASAATTKPESLQKFKV